MPLGLGLAALGGGVAAAGGLAGLGLPAMTMGGFNGNTGFSPFGQTTPAYNFVPSWLTADWTSPSTTPLPTNDDDTLDGADAPPKTDVTNDDTDANAPTSAPSPSPSGSGGTRGPWDSDAAWNNGGAGGHSGGGGSHTFCLSLTSSPRYRRSGGDEFTFLVQVHLSLVTTWERGNA